MYAQISDIYIKHVYSYLRDTNTLSRVVKTMDGRQQVPWKMSEISLRNEFSMRENTGETANTAMNACHLPVAK